MLQMTTKQFHFCIYVSAIISGLHRVNSAQQQHDPAGSSGMLGILEQGERVMERHVMENIKCSAARAASTTCFKHA